MNLAVSLDWHDVSQVEKLLANVTENKYSLERYINTLKETSN